MKPVLAICTMKYSQPRSGNSLQDHFLRFDITFDDGSTGQLTIEIDEQYTRPQLSRFVETGEKIAGEFKKWQEDSWQDLLFKTWRTNYEQNKLDNIKTFNYTFSTGWFSDELTCSVSKREEITHTGDGESTSCFEEISDYFSEKYDDLLRFFDVEDEEEEVYKFYNSNSCFNEAQIESIVNLINTLEKEVKSVWYPNKERKGVKIKGLKTLLDESTKENATPRQAILSVIQKYEPELTMGFTSRTSNLIDELISHESNRLGKS